MADSVEREYTSCLNDIFSFRALKGIPKINILLFGSSGSGKTSIVSTVDSIFRGRISRRVPYGLETFSNTRVLTKYSFEIERPGGSEGPLEIQEAPFVIWDIAGWSDYGSGQKRVELGYVVDGNVPNRFDLSQPILLQGRDFIPAPEQADKVHCMCFVLPCDFSCITTDSLCRLREMKTYAMNRGIPMLVFLTKVDQYDAEVAADSSKLKASKGIKKIVQEMAQRTGFGDPHDVIPIKTFSSEYEPDKAVGLLTLRALQHALYAVVDYREAAQMDLNQWQPTTVLGRPLLSQQDSPHPAQALATCAASTDCDQESADWEAVPPQAEPQ